MDEQIFLAWAAGNPDAYWNAWIHFWGVSYTWLVWFCTALAGDRATGEIWADAIWEPTLKEVECAIRNGRVRWMGRDKLDRYVRRRLRWRVLDRARAAKRAARAMATPRPLGRRRLAARRLLDEIRTGCTTTRDVLANPHVLLMLRAKVASQPALLPVIDLALRYLLERLVAALPEDIHPAGMSWKELAAEALPECFCVSTRTRSAFIISALGVSRNVFDLRVRRLRVLNG